MIVEGLQWAEIKMPSIDIGILHTTLDQDLFAFHHLAENLNTCKYYQL